MVSGEKTPPGKLHHYREVNGDYEARVAQPPSAVQGN